MQDQTFFVLFFIFGFFGEFFFRFYFKRSFWSRALKTRKYYPCFFIFFYINKNYWVMTVFKMKLIMFFYFLNIFSLKHLSIKFCILIMRDKNIFDFDVRWQNFGLCEWWWDELSNVIFMDDEGVEGFYLNLFNAFNDHEILITQVYWDVLNVWCSFLTMMRFKVKLQAFVCDSLEGISYIVWTILMSLWNAF